MKQKNPLLLSALVLIPMSVFAVDVFVGEVDDDYYYSNSVKIEGAQLPSDINAETGSSSVALTGSGTITVGANSGGGFPRISVVGGTTITSTRDFTGKVTKNWWDGILKPPGKIRVPSKDTITGYSKNHTITPVEAYKWGMENERFYYSVSVTVAVPLARETNGQVLYVAERTADGGWSDIGQHCVVQDGLCVFELNAADAIVLYKINYDQCDVDSVENGAMGSAPGCIVSCNIGFALGCDGLMCHPEECRGGDCPELCGGFSVGSASNAKSTGSDVVYTGDYREFYRSAADRFKLNPTDRIYRDMRYRGSNADEHATLLDEEGLDGEELDQVRAINAGKLSRDIRGGIVESNMDDLKIPREVNSEVLDYMLYVRSLFSGDNDPTHSEEMRMGEELEEDVEPSDEFHAAAPMLPSTGPSVFVIIAIIGLGLMVLGAFKRD